MPIPKNIPGTGGAQRRPPGLPQTAPQGLPRPQNGLSNQQTSGLGARQTPPVKPEVPDFELPDMDLSGVPNNSREQSFGNSRLSRIPATQSGPIKNPYDSEDDDTFTTLSVDEQLADENREAREREALVEKARRNQLRKNAEAEKTAPAPRPAPKPLPGIEDISDDDLPSRSRKPVKENKKDSKGQDVFIDEKNLSLEPFGGKRKVRVNDLDGRKNIRQRSQIVQYITVGLVVIMVGFGAKSAFFPPESLTAEEVSTIAAQAANVSAFPIEAGKAFATDFMQAYLTVNGDVISKEALGYYYSGTLSSGESPNRVNTPNFKQTIVYGPTVYESKGLTPYSARYTIGALVKPESIKGAAPVDGSSAKWVYFNVNVYYDKTSQNFSITPDSPSVVPAVEVGDPNKVPLPADLGVAELEADAAAGLSSVIHGFIKGYAVSSPTDHSNLDQYIVSGSDTSLQKGLAKEFVLAGDENDAILYRAFSTADPNEVKVAVTVNWRDQVGADQDLTKLEYKSNYVMTLQKQSNGKYLVSKFAPQYFVMAPKD